MRGPDVTTGKGEGVLLFGRVYNCTQAPDLYRMPQSIVGVSGFCFIF